MTAAAPSFSSRDGSVHVLFVFLDGVGLGSPDSMDNPLARQHLPAFEVLAGEQRWTAAAHPVELQNHVFRAIDASLGVPGLPQSGTGQATLLTGVNCAEIAGRHFGPYPHSRTRPVLAARNIFRQVLDLGLPHPEPVAFANAYPPIFFEAARKRDRWTVTTRACLDAGVNLRDAAALAGGNALPADLTGEGWVALLGMDTPVISEAEAGKRLVHIAEQHAFTLFEYYLTDKAGHSQSPEDAARVLNQLNAFFGSILHHQPSDMLLLVTSDHGNLEDLSTKGHTKNLVPFIASGPFAQTFQEVKDLTGVTPAILGVLKEAA
jgi:2,3-bisphosphoglycerate-independent phosphoglycerate mutase